MMLDLQQVIEALIDRQSHQTKEIERLNRDLKRAFDEIAALRQPSSVTRQQLGSQE